MVEVRVLSMKQVTQGPSAEVQLAGELEQQFQQTMGPTVSDSGLQCPVPTNVPGEAHASGPATTRGEPLEQITQGENSFRERYCILRYGEE